MEVWWSSAHLGTKRLCTNLIHLCFQAWLKSVISWEAFRLLRPAPSPGQLNQAWEGRRVGEGRLRSRIVFKGPHVIPVCSQE